MRDLERRLSQLECKHQRPTCACYQPDADGNERLLWGDPSPRANFKIYLAPKTNDLSHSEEKTK